MGWLSRKEMTPPTPQRVTRSKQQAVAYYNAISGFYDLLSGGAEKRLRELAIRRLEIQPGEKILEIGIGTGQGLRKLAERIGSSGRAAGIDISDGMLSVAQKDLKKAGLTGWTTLACSDAVALPFPSGAFDVVFMSFTLELFDTPEIPRVLAECGRVLKPRGRLGAVSMALSGHPNWMARLYGAMHDAFPVWVDCRPIDSRREAETAGFSVSDAARESMFSLPVDVVIARKV